MSSVSENAMENTMEECTGCGKKFEEMKKCSRCKEVKYCDRECQVRDCRNKSLRHVELWYH